MNMSQAMSFNPGFRSNSLTNDIKAVNIQKTDVTTRDNDSPVNVTSDNKSTMNINVEQNTGTPNYINTTQSIKLPSSENYDNSSGINTIQLILIFIIFISFAGICYFYFSNKVSKVSKVNKITDVKK